MKIIIGNQKAYSGLEDVNNFIKNTKGNADTIICPSFPYITKYIENSKYTVGAQDVSIRDGGATTGEVSAKQLSSLSGMTQEAPAASTALQMLVKNSESVSPLHAMPMTGVPGSGTASA